MDLRSRRGRLRLHSSVSPTSAISYAGQPISSYRSKSTSEADCPDPLTQSGTLCAAAPRPPSRLGEADERAAPAELSADGVVLPCEAVHRVDRDCPRLRADELRRRPPPPRAAREPESRLARAVRDEDGVSPVLQPVHSRAIRGRQRRTAVRVDAAVQ